MDQADVGQVVVSGNYYHQSSSIVDDNFLQDPQGLGFQAAYGTLNLRLDWNNFPGKNVDLFANAPNVTAKVAVADLMVAVA